MTKTKVSATISPERLDKARELTGTNSVSQLLDQALAALIDLHLERQWLAAHSADDLPGAVPPDLTSIPWDD